MLNRRRVRSRGGPTQVRPTGRTRALALLALAMVLSMTTWFSASAVLPQLRTSWSLSSTESAWLTIAVQLGFVVGALVSAIVNLPDRVPARHVFFASSVGAATVNALVALCDGPASALPLRFATGCFVAGIYPPALKIMATWFRRGRGFALGVLVGALTVGSALPHLINGVGGLPWQLVVVASSVATVAGGLITLLFVRDGPFAFPAAAFEPRYLLRAFVDPAVRLANLGYFGHMWELYAMWTWFALFLGESAYAADPTSPTRLIAGVGTFLVIGVGAVGCWLGGVLGDRWGRTRTAAAAMAISGSCALLIGLSFGGPLWLVLAIGVVWGVTIVADSAQFSTMVTELADQAYVGTALTVQLAVGFSLTLVTIWLVPLVRDAVSWHWAFALLTIGPLLGVAAMLRLRARPESSRIALGRR